jgi:HK97 family phage major capsid protein
MAPHALARLARNLPPAPIVIGFAFALAALAVAYVAGVLELAAFGPLLLVGGTVLEIPDLKSIREKQGLVDLVKQIDERMTEIHTEHGVEPLTDTEREEWSKLKDTRDEAQRRVEEYEKRLAYVQRISDQPEHTERDDERLYSHPEARGSNKERDIYDLSTIRVDLSNPERTRQQLHDRARKAIEVMKFPITEDPDNVRVYGGWSNDRARGHVERLLDKAIDEGDETGDFARYVLASSDPSYKRAFSKLMRAMARNVPAYDLTAEEQRAYQRTMAAERALGLGTTGVPLPFTLDASVIPTSNSVVNPWRAICRTEQVVTNNWKGATSGAITAAYAAEATEASDNTPTMAQPSVDAVRAQAFVPFSIEADQDWAALQREMSVLIADAKDDLESNKFFSGSGTNEPFGLNAMSAGADIATAGVGAFVIGDTFKLEEGVVPRARPRSTIVGNRTILNKIRQFDTAGGAGLWLYWPQGLANKPSSDRGDGNTGAAGLGYPVYESSQMLATVTTGSRILLMGNFRYFIIIDRVGMSLEIIPHLFGAANRFPTGQRGLYAFWRNGGKTLSESQFKFLKVA